MFTFIVDYFLDLFFLHGSIGKIEFHCLEEEADYYMVTQGEGVNRRDLRAFIKSKGPSYDTFEHISDFVDGRNVKRYMVPFRISNRMKAKKISRAVIHRVHTAAMLEGLRPVGVLVGNLLVSPYHTTNLNEEQLWPAGMQLHNDIPDMPSIPFNAQLH
jgi:hypothetical protein